MPCYNEKNIHLYLVELSRARCHSRPRVTSQYKTACCEPRFFAAYDPNMQISFDVRQLSSSITSGQSTCLTEACDSAGRPLTLSVCKSINNFYGLYSLAVEIDEARVCIRFPIGSYWKWHQQKFACRTFVFWECCPSLFETDLKKKDS